MPTAIPRLAHSLFLSLGYLAPTAYRGLRGVYEVPAKMHMLYVHFRTWTDGLCSHFFPVALHKDRSDKVSPTQHGSVACGEGVYPNRLGNMSDASTITTSS